MAAEEPNFLVVEDHAVAALKHAGDLLAVALDPEIHRIDHYEARFHDLVQHPKLNARIGVAKKHEGLGYGVLRGTWGSKSSSTFRSTKVVSRTFMSTA